MGNYRNPTVYHTARQRNLFDPFSKIYELDAKVKPETDCNTTLLNSCGDITAFKCLGESVINRNDIHHEIRGSNFSFIPICLSTGDINVLQNSVNLCV